MEKVKLFFDDGDLVIVVGEDKERVYGLGYASYYRSKAEVVGDFFKQIQEIKRHEERLDYLSGDEE